MFRIAIISFFYQKAIHIMQQSYNDLIVIDGLIIANWHSNIFKAMRTANLTAANCTVSVWDNFQSTMKNIGDMNKLIEQNKDLVLKAKSTRDILEAKKSNKTAIILGFQNAHAFEDNLNHIQIFKELGVGVVQLAYNTQNLICTGCYESSDGGLSDYGKEVVDEMNRVGILCDLSHVGSNSAKDVIEYSKQPVCYSHCLPYGLKEHPRNKTDEELKFIADHGGFIGVTMFSPFLAKGKHAVIDDYVEAIDYVINLAGEDSVGIGTDFTEGYGKDFFEHITHDKGTARRLTNFGKVVNPLGMREIKDFPNLADAFIKAGWTESKIEKVIGQNWLNLLAKVWHEV